MCRSIPMSPHPGGMQAISPGLSEPDERQPGAPYPLRQSIRPGASRISSGSLAEDAARRPERMDRRRGRIPRLSLARLAQTGANGWHPSGMGGAGYVSAHG